MQISLTFSLFHKSRKRVIIFPEIRAKIFHTGLATVSLRSLWVFPRQLGGYLVSSNNLLFGAIIFVFRPDSKLSSSFFWNLSWSRANPPRRTIFPIYDYFISLKGRQKRDLGQDIFRIENYSRFLPIDTITSRCSRKEPALLPEFSSRGGT